MSDARIDAARAKLVALKARLDAGRIDAAAYEAERRAVERELGDALVAAAAPSIEAADAKPSRRLVAGVAAFVLVVAASGYVATGSPSRAGFGATGATSATGTSTAAADPAASDASREVGMQQIAAMVERLAERMKERPDDAQGWTMLARSYTVLGRFADALPAYQRAVDLQPKNASVLADYADAVAATKGSVGNPESEALIARALAIDPEHPKALALAGTVAYDRGDFAGAISRWQTIADRLPPDSPMVQQVRSSIDEARSHLGGVDGAALAATNPPAAGKAASSSTGAAVSGTVTLAPALAARASPDDTVFVFARAAGGGRMPLAVQRARVADLPLAFKLDDSMAMTPAATISRAQSVVIGARISKSGNAIPQPGDLEGDAGAAVSPGATGVAIRIDREVSGR